MAIPSEVSPQLFALPWKPGPTMRFRHGGPTPERANPSSRWYMTAYHHTWVDDYLFATLTTDIPCHLWLLWTIQPMRMHNRADFDSGVGWYWEPRYCFVEWQTVEQEEAGDTLTHHFHFPGWATCQWRWWVFAGTIAGERSPSVSPIMSAHYQTFVQDEASSLVPDTSIITDPHPTEQTARTSRSLVWLNDSTGYLIYQQDTGDIVYRRTTDYGATWGPDHRILSPTFATVGYWDIWYDRWTPGIATKSIHVAAHMRVTTTAVGVRYRTIDALTGGLSPIRSVYTKGGETAVGQITSITRARDGALYVVASKTNTTLGFWRSVDNGATWVERIGPTIDQNDHLILWPSGGPDPDDCWAVNWRGPAPFNVDFQHFDQSINAWATANITTGGGGWPGWQAMAGALHHLSGHLFLSLFDGPRPIDPGDIRLFEIAHVGSIIERPPVRTGVNGIRGLAMLLDQHHNNIYVAYAKTTAVIPFDQGELLYHKTHYLPIAWTGPWLYSFSPAGESGQANAPRMTNSVLLADLGRLAIAWYDPVPDHFFTNLVNDYRLPLSPP